LLIQEKLTQTELSHRLGISDSQVRKYLPLINLSPAILKLALTGGLPPSLTLVSLLKAARQFDWQKQAGYLGLDQVAPRILNPRKSS
jgi:hypothetical protein